MENIEKLLKLVKNAEKDTEYSKKIFELEEGKLDKAILDGIINKNRNDWIIIADLYNNKDYTQKFHLQTYLEFKRANGVKEISPNRINNGALIIYIHEVILNTKREHIEELYEIMKNHYENKELTKDFKVNDFKSSTQYREWKI